MLILIEKTTNICPHLEAFEIVDRWGKLWGFQHCVVIEDIARDLLQLPDVVSIQIRKITASGHKFFRLKFKINLVTPLRKCIFIRFNDREERAIKI